MGYSTNVSRKIRWRLPYGVWTCTDGREVLFDRRYDPIAERSPDAQPALLSPSLRISWLSHSWFYSDATPERDKARAALKVLADWGIRDPVVQRAKTLPKHKLSHP